MSSIRDFGLLQVWPSDMKGTAIVTRPNNMAHIMTDKMSDEDIWVALAEVGVADEFDNEEMAVIINEIKEAIKESNRAPFYTEVAYISN